MTSHHYTSSIIDIIIYKMERDMGPLNKLFQWSIENSDADKIAADAAATASEQKTAADGSSRTSHLATAIKAVHDQGAPDLPSSETPPRQPIVSFDCL